MNNLSCSEQHFLVNKVFENSTESVIVVDNKQKIVVVNDSAAKLLGYKKRELLGKHYLSLYNHPQSKAEIQSFVAKLRQIRKDKKFSGNHYLERKDGTIFPIQFSAYYITDNNNEKMRYCVVTFSDNSELLSKEEQIDKLTHYSEITKLPNITYLKKELNKLYLSEEHFSLFLVKLSRFSFITSNYSYQVGDEVILESAKRLKSIFPTDTFIAHTATDRFAVLYRHTREKEDLQLLAEQVRTAFTKPFIIDGRLSIECKVNIGIAVTDTAETPDKLKQYANTALIKAENLGLNSIAFYSHAYGYNMKRNIEVHNAIKRALENNNFYLLYQPKISIPNEKLVGFEALIRLKDPHLGTIYPDEFISIAEENALIHEINMWVANEACRQGRRWLDEGKVFNRIAINISSDEFQYRYFIDDMAAILKETQFPAHCLEVEITETMMMENPAQVSIMIDNLHALGVHISIDDFGSGYSSYAYLLDLPIDCIKIDKSFIDNICNDKKIRNINHSIMTLAKAIDAEVVAEGVENKQQVEVLSHIGCHTIQGYFYGRPQRPEDLDAFFDSQFEYVFNNENGMASLGHFYDLLFSVMENENLFNDFFNTLPVGCFIKDMELRFVNINRYFLDYYGLTKADILGKTDLEMGWNKNAELIENIERQVISNGEEFMDVERTTYRQGEPRYVLLREVPLRINGQIVGLFGIFQDMDEMIHKKYHDPLTNLHNKAFLDEKLSEYDIPSNYPISVAMLDADLLEKINDNHGHAKGDEFLKEIAVSLKDFVREDDISVRYGSDKYTLIMPKTSSEEAVQLLSKMMQDMKKKKVAGMTVSATYGIAVKENESEDIKQTLARADRRMYANKKIRA